MGTKEKRQNLPDIGDKVKCTCGGEVFTISYAKAIYCVKCGTATWYQLRPQFSVVRAGA